MDLLVPLPPDARGREPAANAFAELHNLVVAAETVYDVGPGDTARIARERGVDLGTAFRAERVGLYARLFEDAEAGGLTPAALRRLGHVARTLALAPADVRTVHTHVFGTAVGDALADDCLAVEERLHLYGLQQALGLDEGAAAQTLQTAARQRLLVTVARALCDGTLSPDEATEVAGAAAALGVAIPDEVGRMLNRAAEAWENAAPLPVVVTGLRLAEGETAHADIAAQWAFKRSDALEQAVAGHVSASPLAAMPFPWATFLSPVRTGRVVVTSRRLVLLDDARATQSVALAMVAETAAFADAVVVRVTGDGRRVLLGAGAETGPLARVLGRVLAAVPGRPAGPPPATARWCAHDDLPAVTRAARIATERLSRAAAGWEIPGRASVEAGVVVLANVLGAHLVPVGEIAEIVRAEQAVGVRRTSGRGFTVRFDDEREAHAFASAFWALRGR